MGLLALILVSGLAHADMFDQPSNWSQMQTKGATALEGTVTDLDVGDVVTVTIETKDDGTQSEVLCSDIATQADNTFQNSEEMRSQHFSQSVESLREALRTQQKVLLSMRGPWSPCITSVKLSSKRTALND